MDLIAEAEAWAATADLASLDLRLRVPTLGDAGEVSVAVTLGDPPVSVDACDIMALEFGWGAGADAGVVTNADAGTGTIRLYDPLRLYDPTNTESPWIGIGIGSTARITLAGVPAFRGRIDDVTHDLEVATLSLVDGVAELAAVQFAETSVPAETTSARVTRILNLAGWPSDRRDIGTGGVNLQAGTVAADAWTELLEVTRNELGALWVTPEGKVAWRNRSTAWAGGSPVLTFGCPPSDAFIGDLINRADQSNLVNVLSASRRGGTAAVSTDQASVTRYGRHSHVQTDLEVASDGDRDLWASFYLTRQSSPAVGVARFTTRPDAATLVKILGTPLGAIVRVFDEHHAAVIDRRARWLGVKWSVTPAYVELAVTLGEDASIKRVARSTILDLGTEFAAVQVTPAPINAAAREPGVQVAVITRRPAGV